MSRRQASNPLHHNGLAVRRVRPERTKSADHHAVGQRAPQTRWLRFWLRFRPGW